MATPDFGGMRDHIEREKAARWLAALTLPFSPEELEEWVRRNSRRRPSGMAPALVEPPRGPRPLEGGAAAPLEFD